MPSFQHVQEFITYALFLETFNNIFCQLTLMKKTLFFLSLLAVSKLAFCQTSPQNSIKAGLTYVLFGSGDLSGVNYYNEYNRRLNRYLTFAPSLYVGYGSKSSDYLRFTKASFSVDPNPFISPMRFEKSKIRLGAGPSLRFLSDTQPNSYGIIFKGALPALPPNTDYVITPLNYTRPLNYWTIGYSVVLEAELHFTGHWLVGGRASFQSYASGETVLNAGINVGYRF
jgi:hypothetical protein